MHAQLLASCLDSLHSGVAILDDRWHSLFLNPIAQDLFAVSQRAAREQSLVEILGRPPALIRFLDSARDGPLTARELTLHPPGGHPVTLDCTLSPLDADHWLLELVPLDRKLLISREAALFGQQSVRRQLTQGLAHEIKNPLGGIRGAAQLLAQSLSSPDLHDYTRVIIREADRLRDLVDRLLGPARALRRDPVNLHAILEHAAQLVAAEAPRLRITRDYDPSLPEIQADADSLTQAILNLLRNAAEATEARGEVCLRSRAERQYTLGGVRHRLVLRIEVEDDGPGVPPELEPRLFFPMVTGKPGGSGLGLALAQDIANRHGGLIEYARPREHTRFSLVLPAEVPNPERETHG